MRQVMHQAGTQEISDLQALQGAFGGGSSSSRDAAQTNLSDGRFGLPIGTVLDLTAPNPRTGLPWNFLDERDISQIRAEINSSKPFLIVASPRCGSVTRSEVSEAKSQTSEERRRVAKSQVSVIDFTVDIMEDQKAAGRYFLLEHTNNSQSWEIPSVRALLGNPGVYRVRPEGDDQGIEGDTAGSRGSAGGDHPNK